MIRKIFFIRPLVIGISFFLLASCSHDKITENSYKKLVKSAQVEVISSVKQKQFPGVVEEAEEVNLAFRVAGPIQKIYVKEGEYVKKGQVIAEMDVRDYMVQKNAIEAQANQLQSEYERVEELNKRKGVADNDFEKMKAGKEMVEAKLKNANDQLNDTKLYAPFSGYITNVMYENGEMVNAGMPIATMIDISSLKIEINIPASLFVQKDNITNIYCTQEAIPDVTYPLTLCGNNIKANNNGLYKLYLYYKPEAKTKLVPGMNVLVSVQYVNSKQDLLQIPASAIFQKKSETYVWIINDSIVTSRKIETNNLIKNGFVGIISGLKQNEKVVVGGLNLLKENEVVRVVAPQSATNIGNIL